MCVSLVDDLKKYDVELSASATGKIKAQTPGSIASMLDHALEEMFVPWLEGTRYLDSESKNLIELYAGLLSRFTRYHVRVLQPDYHQPSLNRRKRSSRPSRIRF